MTSQTKPRESKRNILLLSQAVVVSRIGSEVSYGALTLWSVYHFNSGFRAGLLTSLPMAAGIVASLFIGPVIDRGQPRMMMILSDRWNTIFSLAIGAAILFSDRSPGAALIAVVVFKMLSAVASAFFEPSAQVLLPLAIGDSDLHDANSKLSAAKSGSSLFGTTLSGLFFRLLGPTWIFIFDGISYFFSSLLLPAVSADHRALEAAPEQEPETASYFSRLKEGADYVRRETGLISLLALALLLNFALQPIGIVLAFYTKFNLGLPPYFFGILLGAFSLSNFASVWLTPYLLKKASGGHELFVTHIFVIAAAQLLLAATNSFWFSCVGMIVTGFAQGPLNILIMTAIQRQTPHVLQGRVQSLLMAFFGLSSPFGMMVAGIATDALGVKIYYWFAMVAASCVMAAVGAGLSQPLKRYLR